MKEIQKEIINGILLGDGYAEKRGKKTRIRLRKAIEYKGYMEYLMKEMKELTTGKLSEHKGKTRSCYFSTKSMEELNIYREIYYEGKRRVIPSDIERRLSPRTIAIWIMDDGHKSRGNIVLNTHRYEKEEQERLLEVLKEKYGIKGTINKDRDKYRILISAKSTREILIPMVKENIHESYRYKIESC